IRLGPNYPNAYAGLGMALLQKGQFAKARQVTLQSLKLLPPNDPWLRVAHEQLQECDSLLALDQRLAAFVDGAEAPPGIQDRLALVDLCRRYKHYNASAVRLSAGLFASRPALADDLGNAHRYQAACSAVLAAAGKGL